MTEGTNGNAVTLVTTSLGTKATADARLTAPTAFDNRWHGAWVELIDAAGTVIGTYQVLSLDSGTALLAGASEAVGQAVTFRGVYLFDGVEVRNDGVTAPPVLSITKNDTLYLDADASGDASPGDELLYVITVENTGNTSATSVVLTDAIPEHVELLDATVQISQGTVTSFAPAVELNVDLGEVIPGVDATVSFRVTIAADFPPSQTVVSNQASLASAELDPILSDDPETGPTGDPTVTPVVVRLPELSLASVEVIESATEAVLTLTLSKAGGHDVVVSYATSDQTATDGFDYTGATGEVTIPAGQIFGTIAVTLNDDVDEEPNETFVVTLTGVYERQRRRDRGDCDDRRRRHVPPHRRRRGGRRRHRLHPGDLRGVVDGAERFASLRDLDNRGAYRRSGGLCRRQRNGHLRSGHDVPDPDGFGGGDTWLEDDETFAVLLTTQQNASGIEDGEAIATILDDEVCVGPSLLRNGGAEEREVDVAPRGDRGGKHRRPSGLDRSRW